MDVRALIEFLRRHKLAVEATVAAGGAPQAAVVGIGVTDRLEIVFDTVDTRKLANLRRDPRVALVIGWDQGITAQIEGLADEPSGADGERIRAAYFAAYPDGVDRLAWNGITHVRVRPTWVRYSDFTVTPPEIVELDAAALAAIAAQ